MKRCTHTELVEELDYPVTTFTEWSSDGVRCSKCGERGPNRSVESGSDMVGRWVAGILSLLTFFGVSVLVFSCVKDVVGMVVK